MSIPENMIKIVMPCGHSYEGTWEVPSENKRGATCWHFEHGHHSALVNWPKTIKCRNCKKRFVREEIQKKWNQPVYYSHKEGTFNCGCLPPDSSG